MLARAALFALTHGDQAGLGAWVLGGIHSVGKGVGAMSLATEAPCEPAQRPIESTPTPASGLSPRPSSGEEAGPLLRNVSTPGEGAGGP